MSGLFAKPLFAHFCEIGSCWTLEHACLASAFWENEMCENGLGLHSYEIRASARPA